MNELTCFMKLKDRIKEVVVSISIIIILSTGAMILMFKPSWLEESVLMPVYLIVYTVIAALMISFLVLNCEVPGGAMLLTILVSTIPLMLVVKTILFPQGLSGRLQDIIYLNIGTLINVLIMGFFISRMK